MWQAQSRLPARVSRHAAKQPQRCARSPAAQARSYMLARKAAEQRERTCESDMGNIQCTKDGTRRVRLKIVRAPGLASGATSHGQEMFRPGLDSGTGTDAARDAVSEALHFGTR